MAWTPPTHAVPGTGLPATQINEEIIDNLLFLHDGVPMYLCECDDLTATISSSNILVANIGFAVPVVPKDKFTIDGVTFQCNTANGFISVAVYADDGNGTTASQLATSGSVAMPSAGPQTVAFTVPSQVLDSYEKYWLAISFSTAVNARVDGTDGPYSLLCQYMNTAHPLPSTFVFGGSPSIAPCLAGIAV